MPLDARGALAARFSTETAENTEKLKKSHAD